MIDLLRSFRAMAALGVLCVVTGAITGGATGSPPEDRLATKMSQAVSVVLRQEPLTTESLEIAAIMVEEAAKLTPNDPEIWRLAHAVGSLAERDELRLAALERLVSIAPADDSARLEWTLHELSRHQTAEQLGEQIQSMLDEPASSGFGPAIRSRLALDLALLERRRGNDEAFADRLAQAVALDPSNQHAASLATGYFQMHVDDPVAEGELLLQLVLSNPMNVESISLLASHLLGHGAYSGAERFYDIASTSHAPLNSSAPADRVADAAIAQFGRGDAEGALRRLEARQLEANMELHRQLQRTRPDLSPRDRASFFASLTPTFATVRAAIHHRRDQNVATQTSLAAFAYDQAIKLIEEDQNLSEQERSAHRAVLRMEQAWVLIWLGGELEQVDESLEDAQRRAELSETAERRFEGWKAVRQGEFDRAISILEAIAASDAPAQLGLGLALLESGQRRSGAQELLAVARAQPGTLIGVYAADVLAEALGRRVPLSQTASQLDALAASYPQKLARTMSEPSTVLGFRVLPAEQSVKAFHPLLVNIEIINNSPVPLAIDPAGPIEPEVALLPSLQIVNARTGIIPPIIVAIDRRLRLEPRERLIVPVDLRRTHLGSMIDRFAVSGGIVRLRGIINFRATFDGSLIPGLLGSESQPPSIWVEGVRLDQQWLDESMSHLASPATTVPDLSRLAFFGLALSGDPAGDMTEDDLRIFNEARELAVEAFAKADGPTQAWLLTQWPVTFLNGVISTERYAEHPLVRMTHLLFVTQNADDPMINEALRSDDQTVRRVAQLVLDGLTKGAEPDLPGGAGRLNEPWNK